MMARKNATGVDQASGTEAIDAERKIEPSRWRGRYQPSPSRQRYAGWHEKSARHGKIVNQPVTVLAIQLHTPRNPFGRTLTGRVLQLPAQAGSWIVHCQLGNELSNDELRELPLQPA